MEEEKVGKMSKMGLVGKGELLLLLGGVDLPEQVKVLGSSWGGLGEKHPGRSNMRVPGP